MEPADRRLRRATEQWRQIVSNFEMLDVRAAVALSIFHDFDFDSGTFAPQERRPIELTGLLTQLVALTKRVRG